MTTRYVIEMFAPLGLMIGLVMVNLYKPLLSRRVREHEEEKRAKSTWNAVLHSLEMKNGDVNSLYTFIRARHERLLIIQRFGWFILWGSAILLILSKLVH